MLRSSHNKEHVRFDKTWPKIVAMDVIETKKILYFKNIIL